MRRATAAALLAVVVAVVGAATTSHAAAVEPDAVVVSADAPPPLAVDNYWVASIDGDDAPDAADDDTADVGSEDEAAVEAAVSEIIEATTSSSPSSFTVATTFGTVPDADGVPAAAYRGVDMAADGDAVFVALQDGGRNWRASVFRVDGGKPQPVGGSPGFTPGPAMDLTLALAPSSTPSNPRLAVAYREGVYHHGYYRDGDDSWVYLAPSGGRFAQAGAAFTNARPRDLSIAFSAAGSPIVAYADDEYEKRATVRTLDKTGAWPTIGDQGFSRAAVSSVKLAVDAAGTIYVAYADASCDDRATVMKWTPQSTNWTSVGPPCLSVGKAAGLSLALANNTTPCIAYGDGGVGGVGVLGCAIDGAWQIINQQPFSTTRTAATSLAFDPTRRALFVAYRDGGYGGRLTVSQASSQGWTVIGRRGFSADAVWRTRVVVTARGTVWVAGEIGIGGDETDGVVVYKM